MDEKRTEAVLQSLIGELEAEARDRVSKRGPTEDRWLSNLRQYFGVHDPEVEAALQKQPGSRLYLNMTRPKTNAMSARLLDLLFPADDTNWSIDPTPVPEMDAQVAKASRIVEDGAEGSPEVDAAQALADEIQAVKDAALDKCRAMSAEIADVLEECEYAAAARDVIDDACRVGAGVMKGPVLGDKARKGWVLNGGAYTLQMVEAPEDRPAYYRVDYWSFFPEPDARDITESESNFVRHMLKPRKMRQLAKMGGFDAEKIKLILSDDPKDQEPQYMMDLRGLLRGEQHAAVTTAYQVWEYTGPLTAEQMRALSGEEIDILDDMQAVVWFCQGHVLKFALHPLDSGEPVFSVFRLEKDEGSVWGYGIPEIMRDDQAALASAWRMLLDNAALTTGPQIEIDKEVVVPADGNYNLTAKKVWERVAGSDPGVPGIRTYHIEGHQQELANIVGMARANIDETTNMPTAGDAEPGTTPQMTALATAIMARAANVIFGRLVKEFDDSMTVPNIRRAYDWLMQFSDKEHIKGDYKVKARGVSTLLVRELQSANLMTMVLNFAGSEFGPMMKKKEAFDEVWRSLGLPPEQFVMSEKEWADAQAADAEAAQAAQDLAEREMELREAEIEGKLEIANMENATRRYVADKARESTLMELAERMNMDGDRIEAKMREIEMQIASKERTVAAEIAVRQSDKAPLNQTQIANT